MTVTSHATECNLKVRTFHESFKGFVQELLSKQKDTIYSLYAIYIQYSFLLV